MSNIPDGALDSDYEGLYSEESDEEELEKGNDSPSSADGRISTRRRLKIKLKNKAGCKVLHFAIIWKNTLIPHRRVHGGIEYCFPGLWFVGAQSGICGVGLHRLSR